jgi:hypothetical protein
VNVLKPHQKGNVITLLENEMSQHEISRKTGIDRKTVRKLARAIAAARAGEASNSPMATGSDGRSSQIPPPWPPAPGARSPPAGLPAHARSACEPHREWIEAQVGLGRNATAIYQELVDRFGFTPRYNSVKRFCQALLTREPEQFDRLEFPPFRRGEECHVDRAVRRHYDPQQPFVPRWLPCVAQRPLDQIASMPATGPRGDGRTSAPKPPLACTRQAESCLQILNRRSTQP